MFTDPPSKRYRRLAFILALLALLLASLGCRFLSGAEPLPAQPGPAVTVEISTPLPEATAAPTLPLTETPTETPTTVPDPVAACPQPAEGASLYLSRLGGFCFLAPTGFTLAEEPDDAGVTVRLYGAPRGEGFERPSAFLTVQLNGPDEGLDSEGYARRWMELNVFGQPQPAIQPLDLGGKLAAQLSELPGFFTQRGAFLVANGYRYSLMLSPDPAGLQPGSELEGDARTLWDTVTSSIVFFTPEMPLAYTSAGEVCPQAGADTRLFISYIYGYCTLYPQEFSAIADFDGRLEGGPLLGDFEDFENVITSLTVGYAGPANTTQVRDLVAPMVQEGYLSWEDVQEVSINGYPAVVYLDDRGPWVHRIALILSGSRHYSLVAQPLEPEMWPDGIPYLESVWQTVTSSIQFFTPWE